MSGKTVLQISSVYSGRPLTSGAVAVGRPLGQRAPLPPRPLPRPAPPGSALTRAPRRRLFGLPLCQVPTHVGPPVRVEDTFPLVL